jgi:hypothetical protein
MSGAPESHPHGQSNARIQQPVQHSHPARAGATGDRGEDLPVDLTTDPRRHLVQRRERRQLETAFHQTFQRHIDQIRGMVPHVRGFPDRLGRHCPSRIGIAHHANPLADRVPVPATRPPSRVDRCHLRRQVEVPTHVIHDQRRDLAQRREVPQPAEALQHHDHRKEVFVRTGEPAGPRHLVRLRRVGVPVVLAEKPTDMADLSRPARSFQRKTNAKRRISEAHPRCSASGEHRPDRARRSLRSVS